MIGIRQQLATIFQGEHAEHLEHIRSILASLESVPETAGRKELDEAFRRAHSLKGAARAVDLDAVEELAAGLETLFSRVRDGTLPLDHRMNRVIQGVLDASEECVGAFREDRVPDQPAEALSAMEDLLGSPKPGIERRLQSGTVAPEASASPARLQPTEMVRVPAENLDRLVRSTGQILTESLRQASIGTEFAALDDQLTRVAAECVQYRKDSSASLSGLSLQPEYSAVTRFLTSLEKQLHVMASQSRTTRLLQQRTTWNARRSAEQLQRDLWSARMAPVEDLFEGFRKMVRDLSREEGKEIDFRLSGSGVRADRIVIQALKDPVMHLLRNSISHGIEKPAERVSNGKARLGSLVLRLHSQRGRLLVEVDDDGRGVDLEKVNRVLSQTEPGAHSADDLARAIFRPGFSTSDAVNHLSGRGMGLSVVYETVQRLQGDVNLKPKEGPGASFLLSVPLSVSTSHLLLASSAGQIFGIPTHAIERLYCIRPDRVESLEGKPWVNLGGQAIPLYGLAHLLRIGDKSPTLSGELLPVMVLKSAGRRLAIWVDEFLEERDTMMQELGMPSLSGNISGGALLQDGTVFVVLNPVGLAASCTPSVVAPVPVRAQPKAEPVAPGILVVDDSVTSRSLEKSILEAHGYRVRVAVDGIEALDLLRIEKADLVITDIQMPRLDGFGLVEALKSDNELNRIPVIIVSSLERPEELERGLRLGADAYVVKRKFDQTELLDAIRQMI